MPNFVSSAGLSSTKEPRLLSQKKFSAVLTAASEWLLLAAVVVVPLTYLVHTGQSQEFIKQVALMVLVSLAVLCWVGSMLVNKVLSLRRTVANPVVLVLLAAVLISALFSGSKYMGLIGGNGQEYQSFSTTLLFVAFFFTIINLPRDRRFAMRAIFAAAIVGGLASLFAILSFAGVSLLPGISSMAFNLAGSTVVLGLFAAATIVLSSTSFLLEMPTGAMTVAKRVIIGVCGICALFVAVIIDFWPIWLAAIVGLMAVLVFAVVRPHAIKRLGWLAAPMVALVISVLMLFINLPLPISAPTEVFPSLKQSINVARGTLVSHPVFGAGPGTFSQEFALHRGTELNASPLWYVQFDRGMSYLATVASSMGAAGLVAWLAIIVVGVWKSAAYLISSQKKNEEKWVLALVVSAAWLAVASGIVFYGASLSLLLLFWLLFALLVCATSTENAEIGFESSPRSGLALTFSFVILIVLALAGWFISGSRLYADSSLASASALSVETRADQVIADLENAFRMDPQSDTVARNLSQAYLIKIQQLFGDSKIDANVRGTQVQNLTAAAVKAGLAATTIAPNAVQNWVQAGAVYEAIISYVSNASDQAIASYERAVDLDPTSPIHPTSIGRVHLAVAGLNMNAAKNGNDEATKSEAQKRVDESLVKAIASFDKALKLKSDYGPASYQIALAYDLQGKIKDAIKSLEGVLAANPNDIGVGFEMASLLYRDEQKAKAQGELESLIKISPSFANGRWLLATIYEEKKEYDKAIEQVQEILKTNFDNKDVQAKLQTLQNEKAGIVSDANAATPPALP